MYHDETYEERQARRDEERRRFYADVAYDVWRSGGNPDRIDHDRVRDAFYDGRTAESYASEVCRRQCEARQRREEAEQAAYPEDTEPTPEGQER